MGGPDRSYRLKAVLSELLSYFELTKPLHPNDGEPVDFAYGQVTLIWSAFSRE